MIKVEVTNNGKLRLIATSSVEGFYLKLLAREGTLTLHPLKDGEFGSLAFHKHVSTPKSRKARSRARNLFKGNGKTKNFPKLEDLPSMEVENPCQHMPLQE